MNALLDHCALKLSKDAHHLEQSFAGWRRRVEPLLVQIKVNFGAVNLAQEANRVL